MYGRLQDKRILVIEDEYFIAADLERALSAEGAKVIGPARTVDQGLELMETEKLQGVLLDINLSGEGSLPIVEQLEIKGVPYIVLTGYDESALPEAYKNAQRLSKPFRMNMVLDAVELMTSRGDGRQ